MSDFCNDGIIRDKLILDIDISNLESWNLNNDLILNNLTRWENQKNKDINLVDYGLTMYDIGFANKLSECKYINGDDCLKFNRVGKILNGVVDYADYNIEPITNENVGNYFNFNGGNLQTFFKLYGYDYEMIPARYMNGVTIECMLNVDSDSEGIFFYVGVRSEDKYCESFDGESTVTNSVGDKLDSYVDEEVLSDAFNNYELNKYKIVKVKRDQIDNIIQNQIAFELLDTKRIKVSYVNYDGLIKEYISPKSINNGWHLLSFVFDPYSELPEYNEKYYCYCRRKGDFKVYSNGNLIWKIKEFDEFYFNKIYNTKERQIGVPFNISIGNGSIGLKNSMHYNKTISSCLGDDLQDFNNKYVVDGDVNITQIDDYINLNINNGNNITIQSQNPLTLLSGHTYKIKAQIKHDGIFHNIIDNGEISISINSNNDDISYLDSRIINDDNTSWDNIFIEFKTTKDCGEYYYIPSVNIYSEIGFIVNKNIMLKNIVIESTESIIKDSTKDNLTIERYFDKPYNGGIQKIRMYDKSLNTGEIIKNNIKEFSNTEYGVTINKGGRLIFI